MYYILNIIYNILNILYKERDFNIFTVTIESMAITRSENLK